MNRTWLAVDANYLCHSMRHAAKLDITTMRMGLVMGFLGQLHTLSTTFNTQDFIICFDLGASIRKVMDPRYKSTREAKKKDPQEARVRKVFEKEMAELRKRFLPALGFKNILAASGYEADDMLARVVQHFEPYAESEYVVLVTADRDMLQCLRSNVLFYCPRTLKRFNLQTFKRDYGINAEDYWKVKAIAGCSSDDIPGVPGVGEKTAIKFLRKELSKTSKAYQKIRDNWPLVKRNTQLVRLPLNGAPTVGCGIIPNDLSDYNWKKFCNMIGIPDDNKNMFATARKRRTLFDHGHQG